VTLIALALDSSGICSDPYGRVDDPDSFEGRHFPYSLYAITAMFQGVSVANTGIACVGKGVVGK